MKGDRPLGVALRRLAEEPALASRLGADPVQFPRSYAGAADAEVVGLLASSLAYGSASVFCRVLARLCETLGPHPAQWLEQQTPKRLLQRFEGVVYRFHGGGDVAALLWGIRALRERFGSIEAAWIWALGPGIPTDEAWHTGLGRFAGALHDAGAAVPSLASVVARPAFAHLIPRAPSSAAKRLNLFLRWMVRPRDSFDLGLWDARLRPHLIIPLDTHLHRIGLRLGLVGRAAPGWKAALELTQALRAIDPADPVRFDFALCHLGMTQRCPVRLERRHCAVCPLRGCCPTGQRRSTRA